MASPKTPPPLLVAAAQAFEDDLAALETVARDLEHAPLTSQKTIQRAGKMLEEVGTVQERLVQKLATLVGAINETRERQDAILGRILAESQRVQSRHNELRALVERMGTLGEKAKEVSGPVGDILVRKEAGASPDELLAALDVVGKLSDALVGEAEEVSKLATGGEFPEVARDADALRQSMLAARNRVTLARREMAGRATS